MKRMIIAVALAFAVSMGAAAQVRIAAGAGNGGAKPASKTIDHAALRAYYQVSRKATPTSSPRIDTMVLYIGDSLSVFYDPARQTRDSLLKDKMALDPSSIQSIHMLKGESATDVTSMPGSSAVSNANFGESYRVIKNRQTNSVSVIDYTDAMGDRFRYEDPLGTLPWKMGTGKQTILKYPSQEASLDFRGRTYTAWFAPDIPVAEGPWKFMGLPGLITKAEDSQQLFSFTLIGLEKMPVSTAITIPDLKYMKCTRAELDKLKRKQGPGMQININAGTVTLAEMPGKYEYMPLELQ
jgi:GLPGLI family protein